MHLDINLKRTIQKMDDLVNFRAQMVEPSLSALLSNPAREILCNL
jgi:hypothetical protein